jgi:hypothetical protein
MDDFKPGESRGACRHRQARASIATALIAGTAVFRRELGAAQPQWFRHDLALRRPPLWRIYIKKLGIVRQQSVQAQPLCLAAYLRALAVQPSGYLRRRICWPQADKFAEFLVSPAGHDSASVMTAPQAWCHDCRFVRRRFGDCIFSTAAQAFN